MLRVEISSAINYNAYVQSLVEKSQGSGVETPGLLTRFYHSPILVVSVTVL